MAKAECGFDSGADRFENIRDSSPSICVRSRWP
jgi:hypothetical protein